MRMLPALAAALLVPVTASAEGAAPAAAAPASTPTLAPAASPAQDSPKAESRAAPANVHLAAAQRLYQKLDLDAALAELQLAETPRTSEDEMVQVLIYRGLIFSETGKAADATDQFKRALAMRPWAEVPPETSPRIAKAFNEARKSVWGMASVKPPRRRAPPPQSAASPTAAAPAAPAAAPIAAPAAPILAPAAPIAPQSAPIATPAPAPGAIPATTVKQEQPKAEPAVAK